jgi:plastocyanin
VAPPDAPPTLARVDGAGTRGSAQARASTLLIAVGILTLCLAAPTALVSAQAPAPPVDPGEGEAVAPQSPAEPPAAQPQPPDAPAPLPPDGSPQPTPGTPEPNPAAPPPAPAEPAAPAAASAITVSAKTASVSILDGSSQSDYVFSPSSITVATGDTVSWTNNGAEPHDVTGSGLDSGTLQSGQGYSHTFTSAGDFSYICSIHPFMKGSVTVQAAGGEGGSGSTGEPPAATAPSSESSAVTSPDAAGSGTQLPSTGMPVWPLLTAGGVLLLAGTLLRRRAGVS